ncbi:MAG TPA: glycosyltransferase family 4 protein [Blastocatellia bacterium]|nr:glycosyltransferase family 4 protein [Blastocatellia bacterium]
MTKHQPPEVLIIVDVPNWAHDYKTRNLQRALGDEYRILKRYESELTEAEFDRADLIIVYYWLQFARLSGLEAAFLRNRHKLLVGICSHFEVEGKFREPALAALRKMARGIFTVNLSLYREFQSIADVPVFYTPNGVAMDFYCPRAAIPAPARPEIPDNAEPVGFRAGLKSRLSFINGLLPGSGGRTAKPVVRVGWAGSLSNVGAEHRGFYNLIVPAIRSVRGARLVAAAREKKWRGPDEMLEFYRSIDIYLCASRSEGTPNPCLEAAACGVPVVTTRVGNMPELIEPGVNGLFVERNVPDIADKITLLRDNLQLRTQLSQSMLASIQAWDWKHQAENYRGMFESVLNG